VGVDDFARCTCSRTISELGNSSHYTIDIDILITTSAENQKLKMGRKSPVATFELL
jgi:hypothetical protein